MSQVFEGAENEMNENENLMEEEKMYSSMKELKDAQPDLYNRIAEAVTEQVLFDKDKEHKAEISRTEEKFTAEIQARDEKVGDLNASLQNAEKNREKAEESLVAVQKQLKEIEVEKSKIEAESKLNAHIEKAFEDKTYGVILKDKMGAFAAKKGFDSVASCFRTQEAFDSAVDLLSVDVKVAAVTPNGDGNPAPRTVEISDNPAAPKAMSMLDMVAKEADKHEENE